MKVLRGHHLFCTALFSGHGYNAGFAKGMAGVVEGLDGGEAFRLCQGPDCICSACPHLLPGGGCALGTADVAARDREALRVLGLSVGEILDGARAKERLSQVSPEGFLAVCGGCRWAGEGLCSHSLLRAKLGL